VWLEQLQELQNPLMCTSRRYFSLSLPYFHFGLPASLDSIIINSVTSTATGTRNSGESSILVMPGLSADNNRVQLGEADAL
jgi:hypothetical protein